MSGPTREEILAALDEMAAADRAVWNARQEKRPWSEWSQLVKRFDAAGQALNSIQNAAIRNFAESRGWRYDPKRSGHHLWSFVDPYGREAGVVLHTNGYPPLAKLLEQAPVKGYNAEHLPFSWWTPRGDAVLITQKTKGAR